MLKLEPHEIRCLRAIQDGSNSEFGPCGQHTLSRLMAKGLVNAIPQSFLPLPLLDNAYTLTEAGKEALYNHDKG